MYIWFKKLIHYVQSVIYTTFELKIDIKQDSDNYKCACPATKRQTFQ